MVGHMSENAYFHTGGGKLIQGIPEEISEEIMVGITPNPMDSAEEYDQQWREVFTKDFLLSTVAQTVLMGGGFAGFNYLKHAGSLATNKDYREYYRKIGADKKALRELYNTIDGHIKDPKRAEQIMMSVNDTHYTTNDLRNTIDDLRANGKTKQADQIERGMFHNYALMALRTGSLDTFRETLERQVKKGITDPALQKNRATALGFLQELEQIDEKYSEHENRSALVDAEVKRLHIKRALNGMEEQINDPEERQKFDAFLTAFKAINPQYENHAVNYDSYKDNDHDFMGALVAAGGERVGNNMLVAMALRDQSKQMLYEQELQILAQGDEKLVERVKKDKAHKEKEALKLAKTKGEIEQIAATSSNQAVVAVAQEKLDEINKVEKITGDPKKAEDAVNANSQPHQTQQPKAPSTPATNGLMDVSGILGNLAQEEQNENNRQMNTQIKERNAKRAETRTQVIQEALQNGTLHVPDKIVLGGKQYSKGVLTNEHNVESLIQEAEVRLAESSGTGKNPDMEKHQEAKEALSELNRIKAQMQKIRDANQDAFSDEKELEVKEISPAQQEKVEDIENEIENQEKETKALLEEKEQLQKEIAQLVNPPAVQPSQEAQPVPLAADDPQRKKWEKELEKEKAALKEAEEDLAKYEKDHPNHTAALSLVEKPYVNFIKNTKAAIKKLEERLGIKSSEQEAEINRLREELAQIKKELGEKTDELRKIRQDPDSVKSKERDEKLERLEKEISELQKEKEKYASFEKEEAERNKSPEQRKKEELIQREINAGNLTLPEGAYRWKSNNSGSHAWVFIEGVIHEGVVTTEEIVKEELILEERLLKRHEYDLKHEPKDSLNIESIKAIIKSTKDNIETLKKNLAILK